MGLRCKKIRNCGEKDFRRRFIYDCLFAFVIRIKTALSFLLCASLFFIQGYAADIAPQGIPEEPPGRAGSSSAQAQTDLISKYLKTASGYFKYGRYNEALKSWNDVLMLDPENQEAREGMGETQKKIAKINDFFGKNVFEAPRDINMLSLRNCLEIAEERSLLFQIAKEQIKLAKIKVWEARRAFIPSLTFSWTKTGGKRGDKVDGIEYGVESRQPVFRSGELIHTLGQSKANMKIAEENYDKVKVDLYFEVASAYYKLAKAKKFRDFIKRLYEDVKPLYKMAGDKHQNGISSDIEFLNAESKFNQIYYRSISADNDYDLARLALEQQMNMKDIGIIDIEAVSEKKTVDKDMDTCFSMAMENRPDLKMSEYTVKSTEYGKKIAEARGLPQFDVTGYYKKASEVTEPQGIDPHKKWYAGFEAVWPLLGNTATYSIYKKEDTSTISSYYAGSMAKGQMVKLGVLDNLKQFSESQEAEIANARAMEELNDIRKKTIMEIKEAYYGYEKARIQMEASESQKVFREKEFKILETKHSLDEAELSELFESILGLAEATDEYLKAEEDFNVSIAALNKAIGLEDYF